LAIRVNERLVVAVAHSKAAVLESANSGRCKNLDLSNTRSADDMHHDAGAKERRKGKKCVTQVSCLQA
jgi:hypothetical protein